MKFYTFFIFNILISIVLTVLLIDLSRPPISTIIDSNLLDSLQPYYENRTILQSALNTAIIHGCILTVSMGVFYGAFGTLIPKSSVQVGYFLGVSLPLTFILCNIVKYMNVFTDLDMYHEAINPGVPEMVRMLTTVCVSYTTQKFVLPYL